MRTIGRQGCGFARRAISEHLVGARYAASVRKPDPEPWNPWTPPPREKLNERQIREAQEAGAFDDLPFKGERIPLEGDSAAGDWDRAYRMLRNARFAPTWIETDKEACDLLA